MKKTVCISGRIVFPLREGKRAVIQHRSGMIYTSSVVEILESTADYVCFETMNSVYQVALSAFSMKAALPDEPAMCA